MISASFGRSGCLIWSDEDRIFISKISAGLPEQLAIKQEEAANVPICAGVIHTNERLLRYPRKPGA